MLCGCSFGVEKINLPTEAAIFRNVLDDPRLNGQCSGTAPHRLATGRRVRRVFWDGIVKELAHEIGGRRNSTSGHSSHPSHSTPGLCCNGLKALGGGRRLRRNMARRRSAEFFADFP